MADNSRVGILIEAKDNASSTIKNVKGNLNELGKGAGEISSLSGAFNLLGKAAGLAGVAIGAIQVGKAVTELAQLGAQAQRIETSFQTLAQQVGISSDKLLSDLQKASSGTISNTELMLTANRALALGVADSSAELQQLMEVAIARGKALGLSAQQAFNDLVTGIGRISPLILDNLGIITGGEKVFDDYAKSIGKVGSQLSDTERKQALVNKVIAESRDLVKANAAAGVDAAASFERVAASFENIKTDLGKLFGPAIAQFADAIAGAVNVAASAIAPDTFDEFEKAQKGVTDLTKLLGLYNAEIEKSQKAVISGDSAGFVQAATGANNLMMSMIGISETYNKLASQFGKPLIDIDALRRGEIAYTDASIAAEKLGLSAASSVSGIQNQQSALANLGGSLAVLGGEYQRVIALQNLFSGQSSQLSGIAADVIGAAGASEGLKFLRQQNAELAAQQKIWQDTGYSVAEVNALSQDYINNVRKTAEETYVFGQAATKANQAAQASARALKAEYEDIKSKVGNVLSSALNDIGGVDINKLLPREDAVNENARRLADIAVNGFKNQDWLGEFAQEVPDIYQALIESGDPKATAARMLKEFQDGLRPELIDKEKAKQLVRRAITGEQNTKALTDEIAREIAQEMGVSLQTAQDAAQKALGGKTTEKGTQEVKVIPTIDKSQLGSSQLDLTATVTTLNYADDVSKDIHLKGIVDTVELAKDAVLPPVSQKMTVNDVSIDDNATIEKPVLKSDLYIENVLLLASAVIPTVELSANITVIAPDTTAITERPLQMSATVSAVQLGDNVALPILAAQMVVDNIVIANGIAAPVPTVTSNLTIDSVVIPEGADIPDVSIAANVTVAPPDTTSFTERPLQLSAVVGTVDWQSAITDDAPEDVRNALALRLPVTIDWETTDTETARTALLERLTLPIAPFVSFEGVDTETPLAMIQGLLTPTIVPVVDYLSITQDELVNAGFYIAGGIQTGIATFNLGAAIVAELDKAQAALRENGIVSGRTWGSGFNSGAGEYIASIVSTVVALALSQIAKTGSRTGAQS